VSSICGGGRIEALLLLDSVISVEEEEFQLHHLLTVSIICGGGGIAVVPLIDSVHYLWGGRIAAAPLIAVSNICGEERLQLHCLLTVSNYDKLQLLLSNSSNLKFGCYIYIFCGY
jgi:hypothetical protein